MARVFNGFPDVQLNLNLDGLRLGAELAAKNVDVIGLIASTRRSIGIVLLSNKIGQTVLEREEMMLLQRLLHQGGLARPRHPGDAGEHPQGKAYLKILQIV